MPLPANFNTGHVHGHYIDLAGDPISGSVTFSARANRLIDQAELLIIIPKTLTVPLDDEGEFSVDLPATDDPDIQPVGFTYTVTERFTGGFSYTLELPVGSSIDLSTVVSVSASSGVANLIGPAGPPGSETVWVWDGDSYELVPEARTFIGPNDPADEGFTLVPGDQWEETP